MAEQQNEKMATQEAAANETYLSKMGNLSSLDNLVKAAEDYHNGVRKAIWPTGYIDLDLELDGGFYGSQLAVCGSISSLGKLSQPTFVSN